MEIRNFDAYSPLHKSGHTSKGDQLKWKIDDRWYKADYMGYEGLSEVLVSDLLQKSTCPFPFVEYEAAVIEYNGKIFQGCSSLDFLKANQVLIPLEKLYRRYTGESLAVKLSDFADVSERIQYLVTQVEEITKIDNFGAYLNIFKGKLETNLNAIQFFCCIQLYIKIRAKWLRLNFFQTIFQ